LAIYLVGSRGCAPSPSLARSWTNYPFGPTITALGLNAPSGKLQSALVPTVETLHWGLSIQYSTYYLTSRFTGGPPKEEPLNQLLPLVEFSFDTPRDQNTAATMNPGFAYVAAVERHDDFGGELPRDDGGSSTGFRAARARSAFVALKHGA
jgi:hypothetical protein